MNEETTLLKCESCGGYHPEKDCITVVIRVTVGKNCPLPNMRNNAPAVITTTTVEQLKVQPEVKNQPAVPEFVSNPNLVKILNKEEKKAYLKENKNIPREFAKMAIPPTHPDFESKGAKVILTESGAHLV